MFPRKTILTALLLCGAAACSAFAQGGGAEPREVQLAVEKGLFFVERSAVAWWSEKKCASCHDGPNLLFAHNIAKRQGFPIDQQKLDFWTARWVLVDGLVHERKDGRKDAGGMLGAPLTMLFRDTHRDRDPQRAEALGKLMQVAGKDWQQEDGSWDIKVGLDYTPWIALALVSYEQSEMPLSDAAGQEIADRTKRTQAWIDANPQPIPEKTEDLAAWLVYEHRRDNKQRKEELLKELLDRRREDGWWGITKEPESGHQLITAAALFALTSSGLDTSHPVVARTQRLLLDAQQDDGRWAEGGRIFDEGGETDNVVYNTWTTAYACAALSQTIQLPAGATPLLVRDPELVRKTDELAASAADGYQGTPKDIESPE